MSSAVLLSAPWLAGVCVSILTRLKRAQVREGRPSFYNDGHASFARCLAKKCSSGAEALGTLSVFAARLKSCPSRSRALRNPRLSALPKGVTHTQNRDCPGESHTQTETAKGATHTNRDCPRESHTQTDPRNNPACRSRALGAIHVGAGAEEHFRGLHHGF